MAYSNDADGRSQVRQAVYQAFRLFLQSELKRKQSEEPSAHNGGKNAEKAGAGDSEQALTEVM